MCLQMGSCVRRANKLCEDSHGNASTTAMVSLRNAVEESILRRIVLHSRSGLSSRGRVRTYAMLYYPLIRARTAPHGRNILAATKRHSQIDRTGGGTTGTFLSVTPIRGSRSCRPTSEKTYTLHDEKTVMGVIERLARRAEQQQDGSISMLTRYLAPRYAGRCLKLSPEDYQAAIHALGCNKVPGPCYR
jgi:hypothetical protein